MLQAVRLLTEMARTSDDRSQGEGGSNTDAQPSSSTSEGDLIEFRNDIYIYMIYV
jgi:hypothetical protein